MSVVTGLLKELIPSNYVDIIKGTNSNAVKSRLSAFLSCSKTYFTNSNILSSALNSSFLVDPSVITDDIESSIVPQRPLTVTSKDSTASQSMYDSFEDLFNKIGTDVEISDLPPGARSAKQISFSSNGKLFNIAWYHAVTGASMLLSKVGSTYNLEEPVILFTKVWDEDEGDYAFRAIVDNTIQGEDSNRYLLWDVVMSLGENAELNAALNSAADAIMNCEKSADGVMMAIQEFSVSQYDSVKQLARQLRTAWCSGGLYGVAMTIVNYFKTGSTASVSDDGSLVFTDNSNYVPEVYTSGVIDTIASSVVNLATVVAAGFARIFAMVASIVTNLVFGVIKAIAYDYNTATTASLVDDMGTAYPLGPWGLSQCIYNDEEWMADMLEQAEFAKGTGIWSSFVPGGAIIYTYTDGGQLKAEFHPDFIDRRGVVDQLITTTLAKFKPNEDPQRCCKITMPGETALLDLINNYKAPETNFNNDANGVLSKPDDAHLRGIITANMILYTMWLISHTFHRQDSYSFVFHKTYYSHGADKRPIVYFKTNESGSVSCSLENFFAQGTGEFNFANRFFGLCQVYAGLSTHDEQDNAWTGLSTYALVCQGSPVITSVRDLNYVGQFDYGEDTFTLRLAWGFGPMAPFSSQFGAPYQLPLEYTYGLLTPKYDRSTFIASAVGLIVTASIAVAATVFATVAVRKKIQTMRATSAAKVESAWSAAAANPSSENIAKYRKACTKANIMAKLYGGQTYSKESYWGATSSGSDSAVVSALADNFSPSANDQVSVADANTRDYGEIITLIRGLVPENPEQ